jgi:hypothetical protein
MSPPRRILGLSAALIVAVAVLAVQLVRQPTAWLDMPLYDYVAFWSAARLNNVGDDPYDPGRLVALQRQAVPEQEDVLVMWPAPWALTPLKPFAALESHLSHVLWMLGSLFVLAFAVDWRWRSAGGPAPQRWLAWLTAATFLPCYAVILTGQLGPLLLLGFVGFLHFVRRRCDLLAGAFLALAAFKPQLSYLFWIALLLWTIHQRRWRVLLGAALGVAALLAWPLCDDPTLLARYYRALTERTQTHSHWSPVWGTLLRLLFGRERAWLQFLPTLPGLVWLAWYWRRRRGSWDWERDWTPLLFASLLTASYGAWPFDLVLLLPAQLQIAASLPGSSRRRVLAAAGWHVGVNAAALVQLLGEAPYFTFVWLTPALLTGWLLFRPRPTSRATGAASSSAEPQPAAQLAAV